MKLTTLCYIEKDDCYLMLHRISKKNDVNKDKWIGIGGHFEPFESPEDCLLREVKEETGLVLNSYRFRGIITFVQNQGQEDQMFEYMCLFTADDFSGQMINCNEGHLEWVPKSKIGELNLWEGDKLFLQKLAEDGEFFSMKLVYEGDKLVDCHVNGQRHDLKG